MKKLNRKGFTLAELLIVVAIIAVLVAVSIPVFTTQLEKSREETDIANLRSAYAIAATESLTDAYKEVGSASFTAKGKFKVLGTTATTGSKDAAYYAYYDIKKGELSDSETNAKGKGTAAKGGCDQFTGPIYYGNNTPGNQDYLVVIIKDTDGVASNIYVGFTDKTGASITTNLNSSHTA